MQFQKRNTQCVSPLADMRTSAALKIETFRLSARIMRFAASRDDWVGTEGRMLAKSLRVWSALAEMPSEQENSSSVGKSSTDRANISGGDSSDATSKR